MEQCAYEFDANGNRTKLTLPNNDEIRYFYYGTGHLSAIKYNDKLITEIKRDARHQEIERTQGELTSYFNLDPLGRLTQQRVISTEVNHATSGQILQRFYQYDRTGNLAQVNEQRRGKNSVTHYRYDKLGQLKMAGDEMFSFDPAHNIIEQENQRLKNNQVSDYQGIQYRYDELGNLSERILPNGEMQTYRYNLKDQLIEARIQKPNHPTEVWQYQYDALGRRINKRLKSGGNLQETRFVWDGSHLVQEENAQGRYGYIYTHPSGYEPLAQLHFAKGGENPTACNLYYYHTDQIGVPRELTDEQGKICWYGDYSGWGKLKDGYDLTEDKSVHQPFRLQNQYADEETGLHYNFFRYYEPNMGRFTQLDPIGLSGGENLYFLGADPINWIDPLGLRGAFRPNVPRRGTIQSLENNRYGSIRNNPSVIVSKSRDNRYSYPIRSKVPVELVQNEQNAKRLDFISGELKDWNLKMAGIKGRDVVISSKGTIGNKCDFAKNPMYECHIYEQTKCSLLDTISGKICLNETIIYSGTKRQLVPSGTIVECKEIK